MSLYVLCAQTISLPALIPTVLFENLPLAEPYAAFPPLGQNEVQRRRLQNIAIAVTPTVNPPMHRVLTIFIIYIFVVNEQKFRVGPIAIALYILDITNDAAIDQYKITLHS
jgi:hypothetical protein